MLKIESYNKMVAKAKTGNRGTFTTTGIKYRVTDRGIFYIEGSSIYHLMNQAVTLWSSYTTIRQANKALKEM